MCYLNYYSAFDLHFRVLFYTDLDARMISYLDDAHKSALVLIKSIAPENEHPLLCYETPLTRTVPVPKTNAYRIETAEEYSRRCFDSL